MQKRDPRKLKDIKINNINRLEMDDKSLFLRWASPIKHQNAVKLMFYSVFVLRTRLHAV